GYARVGHRNDDIGGNAAFAGKLAAELLAHVINAAPVDDAVGAGEVDIFEDAGAWPLRREGAERLDAFARRYDDFAGLDLAHEFGADDVERHRFGAEDGRASEAAENERPDAERIARADQLLVGEGDKRVSA